MIKRVILPFLVVLSLFKVATAQTVTNEKELEAFSQSLKLQEKSNYTRTMAVAREKNWNLVIRLADGRTARLSGLDAVGFPVYIKSTSNSIAAATTKASQLWPGGTSGFNLSGSTPAMQNKLGLWEFEGFPLSTHVEFGGRILQKDTPGAGSNNDHATHVAGTMMAQGINPVAKGMAYGIPNILAYDQRSDFSEMTAAAGAGLLLSNHSYGLVAGWDYNSTNSRWEFYGRVGENEDYRFGYYSNNAALIDSILFNAPNYLMVVSAGNDRNNNGPATGQPYFRPDASGTMISGGTRPAGIYSNDAYDIIAGNGVSKNNITIGAVNGIASGYNKPADVVISSFSSWGPTDDGRIKPDFVADGVNVTSPISTGNTAYGTLSGTSMSAPNATGSLLLLQELYTKLKPGSFMRSATLKGLAIHSTDEAGTNEGPDYVFGWGLLNVQRAATALNNAITNNNSSVSSDLLYEAVLNNGGSFSTTVIATGKVPLKATIAWTDPTATVNLDAASNLNDRTKKLVNDLDIRITRAGQTFLPWTLNYISPVSAAIRGDNSIDNSERIDVDSTIPGQSYTITVTHKGSLARGSQAYSLVVSGAGGSAICDSRSTVAGGAKIDSVGFSNIRFSNTTGCKSYTNNTNLVADIQSRQTIPFTVKVSTCDATTQSRIVKIFIDYNNNGVFDPATELAAQSAVLSSAVTSFTGIITVPSELVIGSIALMRVIVQETLTASDISPCNNYARGETQDYRVKVVAPSNDMAIANLITPEAGACANSEQFVTISVANNGTVSQSDVPLTVTIKNGSTTVATLSATYPGTIPALTAVDYTFQTPFASVAGTNYTITAVVGLLTDQNATNNQLVITTPVAAKPATPAGQGVVCGTNVLLSALNPKTVNYYWYTNNTAAAPFALGANIQSNTITADRTYYLATDARASVGAVSKLSFSGTAGSYFNDPSSGPFMKINTDVPLTIETMKFYVGTPGQIRLTLADNLTGTSTGYSYRVITTKLIDVYATNPNGNVSINDPADSGAVFNINMRVPSSGDKVIIAQFLNGASLFRNNGISTTTYPTGVPGIMNYTGNSVSLTAGSNQNPFYYFYYDTRVSTGCASDRVAVVAAANATASLNQVGDSLVSSINSGVFQWVFNDTATVSGANGPKIKPARSGNYKVIVTDGLGCARTSENLNYAVTALNTVSPQEIKLSVSPNPNNGIFQLSFEVTSRSDLSIEMLNTAGQRVYSNSQSGFIGRYSKLITLPQTSSEFYILKIQHNKKTYLQKVIIQR